MTTEQQAYLYFISLAALLLFLFLFQIAIKNSRKQIKEVTDTVLPDFIEILYNDSEKRYIVSCKEASSTFFINNDLDSGIVTTSNIKYATKYKSMYEAKSDAICYINKIKKEQDFKNGFKPINKITNG